VVTEKDGSTIAVSLCWTQYDDSRKPIDIKNRAMTATVSRLALILRAASFIKAARKITIGCLYYLANT
jgi:hypothetical protein